MKNVTFHSIIFDFDSTLTTIEGVDYLAELHGVADQVRKLTRSAMNTHSVTPEMYDDRLQLIRPVQHDIDALVEKYQQSLMPGVKECFAALQSLEKRVYIVSGGLRQALAPVGESLDVLAERIFAVEIYFDENGKYAGFNCNSPLIGVNGKKSVIRKIEPERPVVFVGDGANDIAARDAVDLFIGYGGAAYRPPIEAQCEIYIQDKNFTSLLPKILSDQELEFIEFQDLYKQVEQKITSQKLQGE